MNNLLIKPIEGYKYAEYLLVLNPHEYLRDKINQVKKDFSEKTDINIGKNTKEMEYFLQQIRERFL